MDKHVHTCPRFLPLIAIPVATGVLLAAPAMPLLPGGALAASRDWILEPDPHALPYPDGLRPDVEFWKSVFARYSRDDTVLHDADNLEVVYEVLDTSEARLDAERARLVKDGIRRYRKILEALAVKDPGERTPQERRVAGLFGSVEAARFSRAAYRVRAQRGLGEMFREGLIRAGRWQRAMMEIFDGYGIPPQIAALPHVESSFDPAAHSAAGALGVWQFTQGTGRRYLRIGYDIDERRDILAATHAAARHLRDNYDLLGSWPLAIIAYNHGAAGVASAVAELGTRDVEAIVRRHHSRTFRFASRNFYMEFLAALEVVRDPESYFGVLPYERPAPPAVFILPQHVGCQTLARALRVGPAELALLNPALGRSFWDGQRPLPKGYALNLPAGTVHDPWQLFASIPEDQRWDAAPEPPIYRVQRGDTLSGISRRFGIRLDDLKAANGLRGDRIYAGQTLYLPQETGRR